MHQQLLAAVELIDAIGEPGMRDVDGAGNRPGLEFAGTANVDNLIVGRFPTRPDSIPVDRLDACRAMSGQRVLKRGGRDHSGNLVEADAIERARQFGGLLRPG